MTAVLFMGASFAAIRLPKLTAMFAKRVGKGVSLTPHCFLAQREVRRGFANAPSKRQGLQHREFTFRDRRDLAVHPRLEWAANCRWLS